jgi:hypothetical protein
MSNVISIKSRNFVTQSRAGVERGLSGRRHAGAFLGQRTVAAAIPIQDQAAIARWEKTVGHTTLATVMTAFLLAAAIGAFGLPGLM